MHIGDAIRSAGKHVATGTLKKGTSGYGKANAKLKKNSVAYFKSLATKSERAASKKRNAKRAKQSRQLRSIK